jgi:hypothetical protein
MEMKSLLAEIDEELSRLKQARTLLAGAGEVKQATTATTKAGRRKGWKMSVEGRARIAEAQKKRWAARKKKA